MGVFAPLVGIIGSMQAAEALKLVLGIGPSLAGRLLLLDARSMEWSSIGIARDPACAVCGRFGVNRGCRTLLDSIPNLWSPPCK